MPPGNFSCAQPPIPLGNFYLLTPPPPRRNFHWPSVGGGIVIFWNHTIWQNTQIIYEQCSDKTRRKRLTTFGPNLTKFIGMRRQPPRIDFRGPNVGRRKKREKKYIKNTFLEWMNKKNNEQWKKNSKLVYYMTLWSQLRAKTESVVKAKHDTSKVKCHRKSGES